MSRRAAKRPQVPRRNDADSSYGRHVDRTLQILTTLAKGPRTASDLAKDCDTSVRTITRFMAALERAKAPVYIRRVPGGVYQWALDVEKFVAMFKKNGGS